MADRVQFWFDPVSPWCWAAARWIQAVEPERDIDLSFHVMSLAVLNEGKELPEPVRSIVAGSWPYLRVLIAVEDLHGQRGLRHLYNAIGSHLHERKSRSETIEIIGECLRSCEMSEELLLHAQAVEHDARIRASHTARSDDDGSTSGAPTIRINGNPFFGPAISRVPAGPEAAEIFDAISTLVSYPYLFEYQKTRTEMPVFG
ncbi:mycothiol-dependent nitroreductase Rv2466c family protein [Nocardia yamanashiensis]|uniref:mycothiol-dependent nitroreductase Rv2466c family protein n=1 Tax=Nocardia yamanashiensis TaxID=209247 RepID=UPI0012FD1777|nr:disulfide bond formation protein DsbA [Nocardia yamanashiensis]